MRERLSTTWDLLDQGVGHKICAGPDSRQGQERRYCGNTNSAAGTNSGAHSKGSRRTTAPGIARRGSLLVARSMDTPSPGVTEPLTHHNSTPRIQIDGTGGQAISQYPRFGRSLRPTMARLGWCCQSSRKRTRVTRRAVDLNQRTDYRPAPLLKERPGNTLSVIRHAPRKPIYGCNG